jgi:hypothetical protein
MVLQRRRPSGFVEPCLPSKTARPPSGPLWVHEINRAATVQGPTARWLRLRRLRQLGLPTVLSGATPLAYAKNRKRPAMERVMEQSFT